MWFKARASRIQRRTFDRADAFGPPAPVQGHPGLERTADPPLTPPQRNRLFMFKGQFTVNAMSIITVHHQLGAFCDRHGLPHFAPASIRPSVLSCFYRASGDLLRTKAVANHASVATTVRYVQTPWSKHRTARASRIFRVHSSSTSKGGRVRARRGATLRLNHRLPTRPRCHAVRLRLQGSIRGHQHRYRQGDLCVNFMGCFTCPNAVITPTRCRWRACFRRAITCAPPRRPCTRLVGRPLCPAAEDPGGRHPPRFGSRERRRPGGCRRQLPRCPDLR